MDSSYTQAQTSQTELKNYNDPIPAFVEKLMYSDQIQIKLRKEIDNTGKPTTNRYLIDVFTDVVNESSAEKHYLYTNNYKKSFPTKTQNLILNQLKNIPVYTVVNKDDDFIITAPSSSDHLPEQDSVSTTRKNEGIGTFNKRSLVLFFMNKNDACMYMHEICNKETVESEKLGLKIKITGLESFYKLNRSYNPSLDTRLVADLSEIEYLTNTRPSVGSYRLNPKQRYSKNYFQGTPIYLIKPTKIQTNGTIAGVYSSNSKEKQHVFFKRTDAIHHWKKYYSIPFSLEKSYPNIEVYNLESLLTEMENPNHNTVLNYDFSSPIATLNNLNYPNPYEIQKLYPYSKSQKFLFNIQLNLENIQRIYKGLTWLFTSSTLPSEENAW